MNSRRRPSGQGLQRRQPVNGKQRLGRNYYISYPFWRNDPDFFSGEWNYFIVYQRYVESKWLSQLRNNIAMYGTFYEYYSPRQLPEIIRAHGYGSRVFTILGSDMNAFAGLVYVRRKTTWSHLNEILTRGCFFEPVRMTDEEVESIGLRRDQQPGGGAGGPSVVVVPGREEVVEDRFAYVHLRRMANGDQMVVRDDGSPVKDERGNIYVVLRDVVEEVVEEAMNEGNVRPPVPPRRPEVPSGGEEGERPSGRRSFLERYGVDLDNPEFESRMYRWEKEREMVERRSQFGPFDINQATLQREEYLLSGIIVNVNGVLRYRDPHPGTDGIFVPFTEGVNFRSYLPPRPRRSE